ncbi:MAG: hypothetical protein K1000chlam2_00015 [Chlamydiae bacterium]|nr:hypothetical protein [Chlamydiota bacterium]
MSELKHKELDLKKLESLPIVGKQPESEKEEKFLREVLEYEFYNLEEPGLCQRFVYGDTNNQHTFTLFQSTKYMVPRFLARHLESRTTPIWEWRPDGKGSMTKKQVGTKPRFRMSQSFA